MENLKGKQILVTGDTGSFGSALIDYLQGSNAKLTESQKILREVGYIIMGDYILDKPF